MYARTELAGTKGTLTQRRAGARFQNKSCFNQFFPIHTLHYTAIQVCQVQIALIEPFKASDATGHSTLVGPTDYTVQAKIAAL